MAGVDGPVEGSAGAVREDVGMDPIIPHNVLIHDAPVPGGTMTFIR